MSLMANPEDGSGNWQLKKADGRKTLGSLQLHLNGTIELLNGNIGPLNGNIELWTGEIMELDHAAILVVEELNRITDAVKEPPTL